MPVNAYKNYFRISILSLFLISMVISGCNGIYDQAKYQHPDWLAGKLFTQLSELESLSMFQRCLERTGYDTILDRTGSFTVFAPNNLAFTQYLAKHSEYNGSVENIPVEELKRVVKIHIIQDAWTLNQIQQLDIGGWIDKDDPNNNKPRSYKRQTLLREANTRFWIKNDKGRITIVDSTSTNSYRVVYTRSRKYVPIFFPEYFDLYNLTASDYDFYYGRPFDNGTIHYANAKVLGSEVFAENGFIYELDQVVDPILNVEQLLSTDSYGFSYKYIHDIFRMFPQFRTDLDETNRQPEAKAGLDFDTLYTLRYPDFPFDTHEELTGPNTNDDRYTLRYQNGILVPSDEAFERFIANVLTGPSRWNSWSSVPLEIKKIILRNHMSTTPIYLSDIQRGFYTGEGDLLKFDESLINMKYYASNATFIGLNEVMVPRAFTSVSGPVYQRPGYSYFLYSMELSKVLPAIKKSEADYSFFIIPDNTLAADSSLQIVWKDKNLNKYEFTAFDRSSEKFQKMTQKILSKRLLNQVGIYTPSGIANKEYIENLAGNFIIYNNNTHTVSGGGISKAGYNGGENITIEAEEINEAADNGKTYKVNGWLAPPNNSMYSALSSHTWFLNLLQKAGLYNNKTFEFTFLTEGENYTVFLPSEQALIAYGVDTLAKVELADLLRYHFVKGIKIFTDGRVPSGDFSTLRKDESSTPLFTRYTPMTIHTGADKFEIFDQSSNLLGTIYEAENVTNIMITTDTDDVSNSSFDNITTAVLHEIDFVIHK